MTTRAEVDWSFRLKDQAGIVTHAQARAGGFTEKKIQHRLASGQWQRLQRGVYATFTGKLSREARLWTAVLWAGTAARLSHETAAELHKFADGPGTEKIHVTIPLRRRVREEPPYGVVVHRSDQSRCVDRPEWGLPRTTVADTVLDLVAAARTVEDAYAWVSRAVAGQKLDVAELRKALKRRKRFAGRKWLDDALADVKDGVHSPLERRYARDVERAHGLPKAERQAARVIDGRKHRKDTWYEDYKICVELDGVTYHRDRQHEDRSRDNVNLAVDDVRTFRFDVVDVTQHACRTAGLVAAALQRAGWDGTPHSCGKSDCHFERT